VVDISYFPYKPRDKQLELIDFIQRNIEEKDIIIEAPTGFGKTAVVLSALLPFSIKKDKKIIWAVRTGTETDRPIEELKKIHEKGNDVMGISIRGKKDMCLLKRELKEDVDYEEVSLFCKIKIKNNECLYYKRLNEAKIPYQDSPLLFTEILKFSEDNKICPYYYQLSQIFDSHIIAVNYNYIFNENVSWVLRNKINFNDSILVVDEAHNLQFLLSSLNMKEITIGTVRNAIREAQEFGAEIKVCEFLQKFEALLQRIMKFLRENGKEDVAISLQQLLEGCDYEKYYGIEQRLIELGRKIRLRKLKENKAPRSSLFRLGQFLASALETINEEGVRLVAKIDEEHKITLEIFDMRAKEIYSNIWNRFYRVILCSGTIGSIKSFAEIIGLNTYESRRVEYNYKKENFLSIITNDLSTRGEYLGEEEAKKYIEYIEAFVRSVNENCAIFSASYRIQDTLINLGLLNKLNPLGRKIFIERQDMQGDEARRMMEEFKISSAGTKGVLIASSTGRFAEGADFPGKELEAIFLVGIPFDRLTAKTKLLMNYYVKKYGKRKGIFYSYVLPAIRRASHVLGRATRSPDDKAVLVLGDRRYRKILKYLPKFVRINVKTINSKEELYQLVQKFDFN